MSLLLAVQAAPSWTASAALTEGADTLAAQVSVRVAASLAQTEGADVLAASVGVSVAASAALAEGADVLAAAVSPRVGASAALSEGADVLAAQVGPQVAVSFAQTEGADLLAASVGVGGATTDFSAALLEEADLLAARIDLGPVLLGGGPGGPSKYREKGSAWERLLSPPLQERVAQLEPEVAEVIEAVAEQAPQEQDRRDEVQRALQQAGLAWRDAYLEIYTELLAEIRQQQADDEEAIALVVAALV